MATQVFFINLDRATARRAYMERHLGERGIAGFARWPAVDARNDEELRETNYRPGAGDKWTLPKSLIACFESHRRLWLHIASEGLPAAAVFEDDVLLSQSASAVLAAALHNSADYDVLKIDHAPQELPFGAEQEVAGLVGRPLLTNAASAAGYVVSRRGCDKLIAWSARYSDHLDDFIFYPRPDWSALQIFPAVAVQQMWYGGPAGVVAPPEARKSERTEDPLLNLHGGQGPLAYRLKRSRRRTLRKLKLYSAILLHSALRTRHVFVGRVPLAADLKG